MEIRALDVNDDEQVFEVFRAFKKDFGTIDRVIINAGIGKGAPLGTGRFDANRETAMTNFVAALAQSEAAMEIFRAQDAGHFVMISSMSAMRGMPKAMTTYAATKAGVAHIAEGLRNELYGKPIKVSVLYPGYIASEMNEQGRPEEGRGMVSTEKGVRAMVDAIEKEKDSACVPPAAVGADEHGDEARAPLAACSKRARARPSAGRGRSRAQREERREQARGTAASARRSRSGLGDVEGGVRLVAGGGRGDERDQPARRWNHDCWTFQPMMPERCRTSRRPLRLPERTTR